MKNIKSNNDEKGYTLLELIVVLSILALLAYIAVPQVFKYLGRAKTDVARVQIEALSSELDFFRLDVGRYPTSEEGLKALLEQSSEIDGWRGPYIEKASQIKDPWNEEFKYQSPGQHGDFDIYSLGSDHAPGGEGDASDIGNWE